MPQYIAYVNRRKLESEETLIDYYSAITLGIIDAATIDKAFKAGQERFNAHPDRILINVIHVKKASDTQRKIAENINSQKEQTMTDLIPIDATMNIEAGATLYHQCPVRGMRTVKVARTTKTLIILEDGGRYNRKGYATGDTWKRHVLYIEVKESAEETSKVAAPQKTIESRKEQRTLAQVAENNAEVTKKLEKLNGFVEQYNAAPSQFHKNRIDEQLMWFQRHDISITMDNGDYVPVKDDEEQEQTLEAKGASETTNESAQETDEVVNETIAELKAATPAERFPDALRMSMKVLEMDKTLDDATKALAYSAYLQALADAMCPPQTTNEIQQRMQRKHEKEAISSDKRKKATQHYEAFVKEQEALKDAKEQLKALRAAGESAATSAKRNTAGTTAQKLDAIRAAWVPFHQAIAKIEHVIAQHQDKSDAAWGAYERAQNSL